MDKKTRQGAPDIAFRFDLMHALAGMFDSASMTQADIGAALRISQPRVSELMRGKVDRFSSDKLIELLDICGYRLKPILHTEAGPNDVRLRCAVTKSTTRMKIATKKRAT